MATDSAYSGATRVRLYATIGVIVVAAATAVSLWSLYHPSVLGGPHGSILTRLASPPATIGLALLVLAWAERNVALLGLTIAYLAIVLVPITFGWDISNAGLAPVRWGFLPSLVIPGCVLLLGGIGFALAQRSPRQPPE
jgi:hypothetical protein